MSRRRRAITADGEHKYCYKCDQVLPLACFSNNKSKADGLATECKNCVKKYMIEYADLHRPEMNANARRWRHTHRKQRAEIQRAYRVQNPTAATAHSRLSYARQTGLARPQPCTVCGTTEAVHAHHDDYNKPLEVIWLCPRHHAERHRALRDMRNARRTLSDAALREALESE